MNTDKLVTIDDSTLTTITGGGQSPWQQCLIHGAIGAIGGGALGGGVPGAVLGGVLGCVDGLADHIPGHEKAPKAPPPRPGFPYATESRL